MGFKKATEPLQKERLGRVLLVGHSLRWGGAERVLLNILKHFHSCGYQVHLAAPRGPMFDLYRPYCDRYLPLVPGFIPLTFRPLGYLRALCATLLNTMKLVHFVKRHEPIDVVLSNTSVIIHGGITAKIFNIPSVTMVHEQGRPSAIFSFIHTWILHFNRRVIVASRSLSPLFRNGKHSGKVVRIPEGVSLENNGSRDRDLRVPEIFHSECLKNAPLVGIVGNVLPVKGHEYFLRMAARIIETIPRARFVVIGNFNARSLYGKKLISLRHSLGMDQRVFFTGFIENLRGVLARLNVLVVSSLTEGMPLGMLEGMALGIPVVAFNVGGLSDVIQDGKNGKLVDFGDVAGLAQSVQTLLEDPETAWQMGNAGRRLVEKEFDVVHQCRRVEQVVNELMRPSLRSLVQVGGH